MTDFLTHVFGEVRQRRLSTEEALALIRQFRGGRGPATGAAPVLHPLAQRNISNLQEQSYTSTFTGAEFFLVDHVVQGRRVLPGVAFLEMARAAVADASGAAGQPTAIALDKIVWTRPIVIDGAPLEVQVRLSPAAGGDIGYEITSTPDDGEALVHAQGQARVLEGETPAPRVDLVAIRAACTRSLGADDCYAGLRIIGLALGPGFRGIEALHAGLDAAGRPQAIAQLRLPPSVAADHDRYVLHPSLMDSALQATSGLALAVGEAARGDGKPSLPFALEAVRIFGRVPADPWAVVRFAAGSGPADKVRKLDIDLCEADGAVCVRMQGFSMRTLGSETADHNEDAELFVPAWRAQPLAPVAGRPAHARHWVLLAPDLAEYAPAVGQALNPVRSLAFAAHADTAAGYAAAAAQLLALLRELIAAKPAGGVLMQLVVRADGEHSLHAGLFGLLQSAQLEFPKLVVQRIDWDGGDAAQLARLLAGNAHAGSGHIRERDGVREAAHWQEFRGTASAMPWKDGGVYLVTGGLGGLGLLFAREIATQARAPVLVLAGRSAPDAAGSARLDALRALGADVRHHALDVGDASAVRALVDGIVREHGRLDGVLHTAGVLADGLIAGKTEEQLRSVLAPKVAGTLNLDAATATLHLDCFLLFSSVAGVLGNMGQGDYAAANAFLDAFAHHRNRLAAQGQRQGRTLAVDWPLWAKGGMRATSGNPLKTAAAMQALYRVWGDASLSQALVLAPGADAIRARLLGTSAAAAPRTVASPRPANNASGEHAERLLQQAAAQLLKLRPDDIDPERELSKYGFDSISFTQFANTLNDRYALGLTPTVFFEHPTLREFAGHLAREHPAVFAPQAPAQAVPALQAPPTRRERFAAARVPSPAARAAEAGPEPVAIIGISGRFPMADDLDAFWRNLRDGRDCIAEIPPDRWDWRAVWGDPAQEGAKTNIKWGGFIDGVDRFDAQFFGISPREAELMDPQQRLLMTYVWKAVEDAGYSAEAISGSKTALFAGTMAGDYGRLVARAATSIEGHHATGNTPSVGPNRMSFFLNLHGPSQPVETACSSALIAVHRAMLAIERDGCEMAIAGGINTLITPETHISFSKAGMLSQDGRCKTFSAAANGYVRGEGVGFLVMKKLSAAERDGDHIYGVIRATAENHGGRASSLTAPNPKAQQELLLAAYTKAGIDPRTVGYIEAHGTGTPLGDPVEVDALKSAFRQLYRQAGGDAALAEPHCGIASVKSNIGHLELAAGVAGIIKVLLQLKHKTLVKSLHCDDINPYIDLRGSPFFIVRDNQPWDAPRDASGQALPRRAGVSSFGFGGANAHVVIEEYVAPAALQRQEPTASAGGSALVVLSARNEERLREQAQQLLAAVGEHGFTDTDLPDIAWTLQAGRTAMDERLAFTASSIAEMQSRLAAFLEDGTGAHDLHRGRARRGKDDLSAMASDEDHRQLVASWLAKGKFARVLDLWVRGLALDWQQLYGGARLPRRISLPTYPFAPERHWVETGAASVAVAGTARLHPVLHRNTSDFQAQRFASLFTGQEFFLADHVLQGTPVLPGVVSLEMARLAVALATGTASGVVLKDFVWARPVMLAGGPAAVEIVLAPQDGGEIAYEIRGDAAGSAVHVQGRAVLRDSPPDLARIDLQALRAQCTREISASDGYAALRNMGLVLGPALRAIESLHAGGDAVLARLRLPTAAAEGRAQYVLHPSMMDASIQAALGFALADADADGGALKPLLPYSLQSLEIALPCPDTGWAVLRRRTGGAASDRVLVLDILLCDDDGVVCVRMQGLGLRLLEGEIGAEARPVQATRQAAAPAAPQADTGELPATVRQWLKRTISQLLKVRVEHIDDEVELTGYGFDSIKFIELSHAVNQELRLELAPPVFFEYPTLGGFADYLLAEHRAAVLRRFEVRTPAASPVAVQAPAPALPPRRLPAFQRHVHAAAPATEPVAIIGISGRFPMAEDVDALWRNLAEGRDCIGEIPARRWDWTGQGGMVRWGGTMDGVEEFDPLFFNISPREAALMDPQQRLLMTHVWKAIEDAGYAAESLSGSRTALFAGTMASGYASLVARAQAANDGYSATGAAPSVGPNRMSFFLNLHGPSEPVETACSSALVAVHRAMQAIHNDGCELAIAGGVNTLVAPEIHASFSQAGMLSPDGRCKTFSAAANGYVRGEGVGFLVMKRLSAAERDGDHIYGVIRATAENHGGRASSLTAPNPKAQQELLLAAYTKAGIDPRTVGYIEAHGTGTPLGDPVEVDALKSAFRQLYRQAGGDAALAEPHCGIASVKSNIGHLELAAGVAGIIKVLLQLKHKTLVKSLHCDDVNPYIDLKGSPFFIVRENQPWEAPRDANGRELPRRAGVSSFGFGGANAHVVIEEHVRSQQKAVPLPGGTALIVLSARNEERLREQAQHLLAAINERSFTDADLPSIAWTLQAGRTAMDERLAFAASSIAEMADTLRRFANGEQAVDGLHRGSARSAKDVASLFADDDDLRVAVQSWIAKGKHGKLLALWAKGMAIDWVQLWGAHRPRRLSLPTYPFARERHWIGATPALATASEQPFALSLSKGVPGLRQAQPERGQVQPKRETARPGFTPTTLLLAPAWQPQGPGQASTRAYDQHWVFLCLHPGTRQEHAAHIATTLQPTRCVPLGGDAIDPAARYTAAAETLLATLQEIANSKPTADVLLQLVVGDDADSAQLAGLHGMLRIARLENFRLVPQLLQVEDGVTPKELVTKLAANRAAGAAEIRETNGERQVAVWREVAGAAQPPLPWRDQGVYLITGGAGGLGLLFAREIARRVKAPTLVLTGRSPRAAVDQAALHALEALGARVEYHAVDVADGAAVALLVEDLLNRLGELHGVLHAAGIVRDAYIQKKTAGELRTVLAPKVAGTVNLDQATRHLKLDCFILFSSIAAVFGNLGQADYAAANSFLDGYAAHRDALVRAGQRHGHTLSVNWPLWDQGGMQADAATRQRLREMFGLVPLETAAGLHALYQALDAGLPRVAVLQGDVARLRDKLALEAPQDPGTGTGTGTGTDAEQALLHIVAGLLKLDLATIDPGAELASYGFDSISASQFVAALNERYRLELTAAVVFEHPTLHGLADFLQRQHPQAFSAPPPAAAPAPVPQPTAHGTGQELARIVADLLKLDPAAIDADTELAQYGFDSISAAQFVSALNAAYGLDLTAAVVFEHPTLRGLVQLLGDRLPTSSTEPQAAVPAPQPLSSTGPEPIAIISLAGRFPQAEDVETFWDNLKAGRDCITEIPPERGPLDDFYTPDVEAAVAGLKSYSKWGGFLDDVEGFDHAFFNMSVPEAESNGPKVSLFLETVWTLLERAGYTRDTLRERAGGGKVGVFVGAMPGSYTRFGGDAAADAPPPRLATIANRVSHFFRCTGPSMGLDTMSSSAATAIHMACESLRHGGCGMAIAGGVSLLQPRSYVEASRRRMLAGQIASRSFGTGGGLILSECVGAVLLKPLSAALRDGDTVLAVVRASAASHAGGALKYSLLDPNAQAQLILETLAQAGLSARGIGYVEAAANGSPLSDAVEVAALAKAFRAHTDERKFCVIGTAESNVGHTGPAGGFTQLAKVVLQLAHRQFVPSIKTEPRNPEIRLEDTPFQLRHVLAEWHRPLLPTDAGLREEPRRALINSVGGGGAYVSMVVEEFIAPQPAARPATGTEPQLVVLSARDAQRLRAMARRLRAFLDRDADVPLADIACTLQLGREEMRSRLAVVASSVAQLAERLDRFLDGGTTAEAGTQVLFAAGEASAAARREPWTGGTDALEGIAAHWVRGGAVHWESLHRAAPAPRRIVLPTYPFARSTPAFAAEPDPVAEQPGSIGNPPTRTFPT
ncbi:MAG: SDR family NAD(P)-dependent oxidoreductase [Pseudomonadota bacterium]